MLTNKSKRTVGLFIGLLSALAVSAYDAVVNGIYFDLSGKEATVTYKSKKKFSRPCYEGSITIPERIDYNGDIYDVIAIGPNAFGGCNQLTSVEIPSSVVYIGDYAFKDCSSLRKIVYHAERVIKGKDVFQGCNKDLDEEYVSLLSSGEKASLEWISFPSLVKEKNFHFQVGVKSDSQIRNVEVIVNGIRQEPKRGLTPVQNDGYDMLIDRTVTLSKGENDIVVKVVNASGEQTETKTVQYKTYGFPVIELLSPEVVTNRKYPLRIGIKSDSKIEDWAVTINDNLERGLHIVPNDEYEMMIEKTITLSEGENVIVFEAENQYGPAQVKKKIIYNVEKQKSYSGGELKRIALVIGNSNYQHQPKLVNPKNDATDFANKLETLGFDVMFSLDQTNKEMKALIRAFAEKASDYDVALFYYAGHGISTSSGDGDNYLIPIEADLHDETDLPDECTNAKTILEKLDKVAQCPMKIMILDACRDNPLAQKSRGIKNKGGLSTMKAPRGTIIAYSTSPGDVALDGKERNSPYTSALLRTLDIPGLSINEFFPEVTSKVIEETGEKQIPWYSSSMNGKYSLNNRKK